MPTQQGCLGDSMYKALSGVLDTECYSYDCIIMIILSKSQSKTKYHGLL